METTRFPAECPHCQKALMVRREYRGRMVCCNSCGQVFAALPPAGDPAAGQPPPLPMPPPAWGVAAPRGHAADDPFGNPSGPEPSGSTLRVENDRLRAKLTEALERHERLARESVGPHEHGGRAGPGDDPRRPRADPELAAAAQAAALEALRRAGDEARARDAEERRADRERADRDLGEARDELARLRADREADRGEHGRSLAALRDAWEGERRGWREQVEVSRRQAEHERAALQALADRFRADAEAAARLAAERDARVAVLEADLGRLRGEAGALGRDLAGLRDALAAADAARIGIARERDDLRGELGRARAEADSHSRALDDLRRAAEAAEDRARQADLRHAAALAGRDEALRGAEARHDGLAAVHDELAGQVVALRAEVARLRNAARPPDRLPVLCRDLARWSLELPTPPRPRTPPPPPPIKVAVVAVPVGPPPRPPSFDDLQSARQYVEMLRRILRIPLEPGKPFHSLFDEERFQAIQGKLKEANLLGERLLSQFDRSKSSKDLLWHLMVARRNDEINRKKR